MFQTRVSELLGIEYPIAEAQAVAERLASLGLPVARIAER